jgi:hypothetical protein
MKEVDNVRRIFEETRVALDKHDAYEIKRLSNQTIHTAATSQDPDNIIVAVLVYSIAKLVERDNYQSMEGWKEFYERLVVELDSAVKHLVENDLDKFRSSLGKIRNSINRIDSKLRVYIQDIFRKAEINKAFKLYEHGLSSQQTADLLGITLWDMSTYIGQSSVSEANIARSLDVKKRVKYAEDIFR